MMELPGSFSGMLISPRPAARARRQPADVVGDLHQRAASVLSAPWAKTSASWPAKASNLFGAVTNGSPVSAAILAAAARGELGMGVQPGAHGRPAQGQLVQCGRVMARRWRRVVELRAQPEISWPRVSGVASCRWVRPILIDPGERHGLFAPGFLADPSTAGRQPATTLHRGDVHGRREGIVGASAPC